MSTGWSTGAGPSRDDLGAEAFARLSALQRDSGVQLRTEQELAASRARVLARLAPGHDLWVFGYGSLMWNPAMVVAESRPARLRGFHRDFCLDLTFGRASPENPGLMLGLVAGGECGGIAHRIAAADVAAESAVLWRREMAVDAYRPTWCRLRLADRRVRGLTFVVNTAHPAYRPALALREQAKLLAHAEGPFGTCRDYLLRTRDALAETGLRDSHVDDLCELLAVQRRP